MRMSARRVAVLFFLGTLLLQAAWIFAVPPYRGSDEFDHAYRAASVAEGYWQAATEGASNGRGGLIPAPRQLVTDAHEICSFYKYTGPDNCSPVQSLGDGLVTVASGAASYNPAFYWIIGTPARLADGAASVYVMRIAASLICAVLVAIAAGLTARSATTRWPVVALTVALTPVTVYSLMLPAPNGIEMASALCVWTAMLALAQSPPRNLAAASIATLAVGAAILVTARPLGFLWLALIVLTVVSAVGVRPVVQSLRSRLVVALVGGGVVAAASTASSWWILSLGQLKVAAVESVKFSDKVSDSGSSWGPAVREIAHWFFQSFAAFPLRNEPAPMVVYACGIVVFATLLGVAMRCASSRLRFGLLGAAVISITVPFAITVAVFATSGAFWQGRYTLPYSFGVVLLAGVALDRSELSHRLVGPLTFGGAATLAFAHITSVVAVQVRELDISPLSGDPRWLTPTPWIVGALAVAGVVSWLLTWRGSPVVSTQGLPGEAVEPAEVCAVS